MKNVINDHNPFVRIEGRLFGTFTFLKKSDLHKKKVLNIGCGFGWFELRAIALGVDHITGIEISEDDLKVAKSLVQNSKVTFLVAQAEKLPFPDNSFDTVTLWEVIEHIPKNTEREMFKEINRVLKPKGILVLSTPSQHFLTKILDPAWWLIGHRHYSTEDIRHLSRDYFSIQKSVYKGQWWTVFGLLNMYVAKWIFKRAPFFNDLFSEIITKEYVNENGFANLFVRLKNEK